MPLIQIAFRNNAPSEDDVRHDVYAFSIDPDDPRQPFFFEQSIGGGHGERGGACRVGASGLDTQIGDYWREHLRRAGCGWAIAMLERAIAAVAAGADDAVAGAAAVAEILDAKPHAQLFLQRSSIEPNAEREPFFFGSDVAKADLAFACEVCEAWVDVPVERLIDESADWLRSLSDPERGRLFDAFACRLTTTPSGREQPVSHDDGSPYFGAVACTACGQRSAVYLSFVERQPTLYSARLQGLARIVSEPDRVDAPAPVRELAPVPSPPQPVSQARASSRAPATPGWDSAPDEPPLYYVSIAKKSVEIARDLAIVYAQMEAQRVADDAVDAKALHVLSDGTQSKLYLHWYDPKTRRSAGEWRYTLVLRDAGFDDADVFESACRRAVGRFVRERLPETVSAYYRYEYGRRATRVLRRSDR